MSKQEYRRKMIYQRLMGIVCLVLSALLLIMAFKGTSVEESDMTGVLLLMPLGLWLLLSRKCVLY